MNLSHKLTFSLASIFLLLAFAAVPVMAHQMTTNVDPHVNADPATAATPGTDHALVESITVSSMYLTPTGTITATITFADGVAAIEDDAETTTGADLNEARHATLPTPATFEAANISIQYGTKQTDGTYTYADPATAANAPQVLFVNKLRTEGAGATGSGAVYTVTLGVPTAADARDDGVYRISVVNAPELFGPADVNATFRMDTITPTIMDVAVRPIGQDYANLQGEWSDPFEITFSLEDPLDEHTADTPTADSASGLKLTTLMLEADKTGEVTFGDPRFIGGNQYVVKVTPVTGTSIKPAATVKVTVKVADMADNVGRSTDPDLTAEGDPVSRAPLEVKIAERAATSTGPGPGDMGAPTVTITEAAGTGADDGKVIFTFTFNEALATTGENAFTVADLDVSNSPTLVAANLTTTNNKVFMLKIMPTNDKFPVKVSFKSTAKIADTSANLMETGTDGLGATGTYTPLGVLGVEIDAPANLALGVLTFTITFAELPSEMADDAGQFTVSDIRVSNAEPLVAANLTKQLQSGDDDTEVIYELDVTPMDATKDVTVQLKARSVSNGKEGDDLLIAGEISSTWTPPVVTPETPPDTIMIPAGSYVVVVRDKDAAGALGLAFRSDVMVREWPGMPNLERLFYTGNDGVILGGGGGGALILTDAATTPTLTSGTVGISEIMWGIDASNLGNDREAASQWIELHNLNTTAANVMLSWKTGRAITSDSNIIGDLVNTVAKGKVLDVVTNFFNDRPGNARWGVKGSNGSSAGGVNFVSMARNGDFNLNSVDGGQFNKRYTRTGGATKSRDGRNAGHWSESSAAYLRLRTVRADQADVIYEYIGTPGRMNSFGAQVQPDIRVSRRNVPASPFVINEVANRDSQNKAYEWIEFRNVTNDEQNLRNYLVSIVTSNTSDVVFYQFPNSDLKVPAGGVLLLVASDPKGNPDHPLAVGWNVDLNEQLQVRGLAEIGIHMNSKHGRYKVADPTASGRSGKFGGLENGLPDDGMFVLILRRSDNYEGHGSGGHKDKGVAETGTNDLDKVVDIAGWDNDLSLNSYPNPVSGTGIWPLHQMGGIGGFTNNKLEKERVHYRRHVGTNDGRAGAGAHENKNDKSAYTDVGYTGVGYKRQAADSIVHGGDPGYHSMTTGRAHMTNTRVYISEIMLSQTIGRSSGLPQWIELYNASNSAVNLAADNGWRLVIETPGDPLRTINFKSNGNVKTINPRQTVLIVSATARSFGSDVLDSSTVFPDTRVFNVYRELRTHFGMTNRASPMINSKAFNIRLYDGGTKGDRIENPVMSDEVGNLDGNIRTSDTGMWEYPDASAKDGNRTSLIRVFDKANEMSDAVARPGLSIDESNVLPLSAKKMDTTVDLENSAIPAKYAWIRASQASLGGTLFIRHTWYGNERDYGTPGNRAGQTLPVRLSFFRPTLEDGKVTIQWTTESEIDNAGFNILRSDTRNGEFTQVNEQMIQGKGTTAERNTYKWVDTTAKPGAVYYYQIEDVSFAGEHTQLAITKLKGLISAKGKLTTQWGELKNLR